MKNIKMNMNLKIAKIIMNWMKMKNLFAILFNNYLNFLNFYNIFVINVIKDTKRLTINWLMNLKIIITIKN